MNIRLVGLAVTFTGTPAARAEEGTLPPQGFISLFNAQDLTGWHGMPHFDPRKLATMADDERARQVARWTEAAKQHWTVEGGELEDRTPGFLGFAGRDDPAAIRNVSIKPLD